MHTYLTILIAIKKDVPGSEISVNETLSSKVLHAFCNLATELQQQRWRAVINHTSVTTRTIKNHTCTHIYTHKGKQCIHLYIVLKCTCILSVYQMGCQFIYLTRTSLAVCSSYLSAREGLATKRIQSDATPAWSVSAVALQPMRCE